MKRALITIALLALLVMAAPGAMLAQSENVSLEGLAGYVRALQHRVRAVEERLPALEEQVIDIFFRLGKVEEYEKRIRELERQISELESQVAEQLSAPSAPSEFPSEDVVVMTETEYQEWLAGEILRISFLVPMWELAFDSDDSDKVFDALYDILDTIFGFYDAHSRIVTPDLDHKRIQANLSCYMEPFEPLRDLENATVMEFMVLFGKMSEDPESLFVGCDPKVIDDLNELFSLE